MNLIRVLISVFIVVLLVSAAAGWTWTSAHQAPALATASHVVLGLSAVAGVLGLVVIWTGGSRASRL
jgi:hypothetical protein